MGMKLSNSSRAGLQMVRANNTNSALCPWGITQGTFNTQDVYISKQMGTASCHCECFQSSEKSIAD